MRPRSALPAAALAGLLLLGGCQGSNAPGRDDIQAPANEIEGDQPMPNTGRQDDPTLIEEPDVTGADQDTFGNEGDTKANQDGSAPGN